MRTILGSRTGAALALLLLVASGAGAKTKKADKIWKDGRAAEDRREFDKALELYEKALNQDPADAGYLLSVRRVRFQAGQAHVDQGKKLRAQGKLEEALAEFQKAGAIDPSSSVAEQESRRTGQMIEREKKRSAEPGEAPAAPEERGLTSAQQARKDAEVRVATAMPPPELKSITPQISTLKMSNQPVKVLFETVGKLAGVNVVFDPDYQSPPGKNFSVDMVNVSLDDALDYLAVITKSFWKPLSSNTVFVTNDSPAKRRDYEEFVVKVFYLQNVTSVQELQEIATSIRSVTDIRRLFTYNAQNAILVRATADQVALAEKLIQDLDKPKAEVIIDVIVMEANRARTRSLAATLANGTTAGFTTPIAFTPRNPVLSGTTSSSTSTSTSTTGSTTSTTNNTGSGISLAQIGKIGTNDFSLTLPGGFIQALMSDRSTKILQSPQLRAADGTKATLKIGDRYPYATGSFGSGMGGVGVGISPLVSTQFQFAEVGVNCDIQPRIHSSGEVSLHVELEISSVRDNIDVGGLKQPVIGQRKVIHDLRVKEGEISVLGGLMQGQDLKTLSGFPGLAKVPVLKYLFSNENTEKNTSELLVVLIPHIVRSPEINEVNLRGIAAGNDTAVKLNYAPRRPAPVPAQPPVAAVPAAAAPAPAEPKPAPAEPKPALAPGGATLVFAPASVQTKPGANFTVTLQANGATDLYSTSMRVKYDPKALKLVGAERGGLLAMDGQQPLFTRNIQSESGEASIHITRLPGAGGVSGAGALATFTFQAIGIGATEITFADLSARNSQQQPLAYTPPKLAVAIQ